MRADFGVLLLVAACTRPAEPPAGKGEPGPPAAAAASIPAASASVAPQPVEPPPPIEAGGEKAVRGEHGVVTSVESHATRAGVEVLEAGGNAVDAAVAVGFALAVTHPSAGNVGGGGFMLVRLAGKPTVAVDFRERAPGALTREAFDQMIRNRAIGPAAAGVPGSVAGLVLVHDRYGKLPRSKVMAPAIRLARDGHAIGHREGLTLQWNWSKLRLDPEARRIFGAAGGKRPKKAGQRLVRAGLARTLERIRDEGHEGFYRGEVAGRIVRAMRGEGLISLADLAEYRAVIRQPLSIRYRGLRVEVMPPPSAGGVGVLQSLLLLQHAKAHEAADPVLREHLFVEASKRAHAERKLEVVDPERLTPEELALREKRWTRLTPLADRVPIDPARATPVGRIHPLFEAARTEYENTTHFSVTDGEGNLVSCTTTLSAGFGAKLVVPEAGIVLNNSVAAFSTVGLNLPAPGRRMTSSMAPTLVLHGERPVLVTGSPGGDTIASTITQVVRNVVDRTMTIDRAVEAPRLHHGFVPDALRYERRRPPPREILDGLEKRGHGFSKKRIPIGDANSILIGPDGVAWGFSDPREGGLALAAQPSSD